MHVREAHVRHVRILLAFCRSSVCMCFPACGVHMCPMFDERREWIACGRESLRQKAAASRRASVLKINVHMCTRVHVHAQRLRHRWGHVLVLDDDDVDDGAR